MLLSRKGKKLAGTLNKKIDQKFEELLATITGGKPEKPAVQNDPAADKRHGGG